ncbi:hypothetical protein QA640_09795 [Bradyrhizobium sp. CB82]|uniref:hypothetical protein n=1 Tax=Bradyrhizobium sp. CB82 TaxID=3039159 RepID=UPI0024B23AA5|nr:hypothetical protein [Bradyrhizobium sp. CB82]WFU42720.1 hypothetical protein QA640_09795 [Bradyrhizobium sp. CB82]
MDENKRFVEDFANPHSWLLTAENLHDQATEMYRRRDQSSILTKTNAKQEIVRQVCGVDKPIFLLGGFALENAMKAFLVYENPHWISNGKLSSELKSHKLRVLRSRSKLIPYKNSYTHILEAFESGLDSWFRYPCALTVEDTQEERNLYEYLWHGYSRLMSAYGKKLVMLLDKEWKGPHGTRGRWKVQGETLGWRGKPLPAYYRRPKRPQQS